MKGGNGDDNKKGNGSVDASSIAENKEAIKKRLERHLKDTRQTLKYDGEFEHHGKKEAGVSEGHVAKDGDGRLNMVKPFVKKSYGASFNYFVNKSRETEWWDNIREFIAGDIFGLLLYGKSPNIGLVEVDKDNVAVRSRFLEGATTLYDFVTNKKNAGKKVVNVEKIFAACLIVGDPDFHSQNVMVHQNSDTGEYELDKIDHGRSFLYHRINPSLINVSTAAIYYFIEIASLYNGLILNNQMRFDVAIFHEELKRMVNSVTPEMVSDIVDRKIYALKQAGVELGDPEIKEIEMNIKEGLNRQFQIVKNIVRLLDFLKESSKDTYKNLLFDTNFGKDGKVMRAFFEDVAKEALANKSQIDGQDPLVFLIENGLMIYGNDPVLYAIANNMTIDGQDPFIYAVHGGYRINETDAIVYLMNKGMQIDGQDPLAYAVLKRIKISYQDPMFFALNKGIRKIGDIDIIEFAIANKVLINGDDPIKFAISNGIEINGQNAALYATDRAWKVEGQDPVLYALMIGDLKENKMLLSCKPQVSFDSISKADATAIMKKLVEAFDASDNKEIKAYIEDLYTKLQNQIIDKDASVVTLKGSGFDKAEAYTIARKMEKLVGDEHKVAKRTLRSGDIVVACDIHLASKIEKVRLELQKNDRSEGSAYDVFVDKVSEIWKKIAGSERLSMSNLEDVLTNISSSITRAEKIEGDKIAKSVNEQGLSK